MRPDAPTPAEARLAGVLLVAGLALGLMVSDAMVRPRVELDRTRAALRWLDRSTHAQRLAAALLLVGYLAAMVIA